MKIDNAILRGTELSNFQEKVNKFFKKLHFESTIHLTPSELLNKLEAHIVKKANEVASTEIKKWLDWFSEAEKALIESINKSNLAVKAFVRQPPEDQELKDAIRQLMRKKRKAKAVALCPTPKNSRKKTLQ